MCTLGCDISKTAENTLESPLPPSLPETTTSHTEGGLQLVPPAQASALSNTCLPSCHLAHMTKVFHDDGATPHQRQSKCLETEVNQAISCNDTTLPMSIIPSVTPHSITQLINNPHLWKRLVPVRFLPAGRTDPSIIILPPPGIPSAVRALRHVSTLFRV